MVEFTSFLLGVFVSGCVFFALLFHSTLKYVQVVKRRADLKGRNIKDVIVERQLEKSWLRKSFPDKHYFVQRITKEEAWPFSLDKSFDLLDPLKAEIEKLGLKDAAVFFQVRGGTFHYNIQETRPPTEFIGTFNKKEE